MEWKQIPDYPDYQISDTGLVKTKHGHILKTRDKIPAVELYIGKVKAKLKVAGLFYMTFIKPIRYRSRFLYRDGNAHSISRENLFSIEDRNNEIHELYNQKVSFTEIANKYKLSVKTVQNILQRRGVSLEIKEFSLPKHSSKGKMELQTVIGEFTIPYADNCTVRPNSYTDHYSQMIWR